MILQWGSVSAKTGTTVNLIKTFSNNNYFVTVEAQGNNSWGFVANTGSKTINSFVLNVWQTANGGDPTKDLQWFAIGY